MGTYYTIENKQKVVSATLFGSKEIAELNADTSDDADFFEQETGSSDSTIWGEINGSLPNQTDLQTALDTKLVFADITSGSITPGMSDIDFDNLGGGPATPSVTADNEIPRFDGADGQTLQGSGARIDDGAVMRANRFYAFSQDTGLKTPGYGLSYLMVGGAVGAACYHTGFAVRNSRPFGFSSSPGQSGYTTSWYEDAAGVVHQRNGDNEQTQRLANNYTSPTDFESFQTKANVTEYQIGSAVGSAGGSNRDLEFGHWDSAGAFSAHISILSSGLITLRKSGHHPMVVDASVHSDTVLRVTRTQAIGFRDGYPCIYNVYASASVMYEWRNSTMQPGLTDTFSLGSVSRIIKSIYAGDASLTRGLGVFGTPPPAVQPPAISDVPTGGSATAAENATAINSILAAIRGCGQIAT